MDGLNRDTCSWAKDGSCPFTDGSQCRTCKLSPEDSAFHASRILGREWHDLEALQHGIHS